MTDLSAEAMRDHAFDQRERMARVTFDVTTVGARIKAAASAGRTDLRLVQDAAVDMSLTRAALWLTAWLQKRGFVIAWKPAARHERHKNRPSDLSIAYCELVIDWSGVKSLGGFLSEVREMGVMVEVDAGSNKNSEDGLAEAPSATNT